MQSLNITPTPKTPEVIFEPENGVFTISGKSIPDNAELFYNPILVWFDEYMISPNEETIVSINLDYFNISSSKRLLFLLYKLNELHLGKHNVRISWRYNEDDEDMFEVGQDYAFMVKVPFDFVSYTLEEANLVLS